MTAIPLMTRRPDRSGFTLIELILVIAIVAVMLAVIFIALDPGLRLRTARNVTRLRNVTAIADALLLKATDQGQNALDIPASGQWRMLGKSTMENLIASDYSLGGDANRNGTVDGADYTAWAYSFQANPTGPDISFYPYDNPQEILEGYKLGDFTHDGEVDGADYTTWATYYGQVNTFSYSPCRVTCPGLGGSTYSVHLAGATDSVRVTDYYANTTQSNGNMFFMGTPFSVAFWFKLDSFSNTITLLSKQTGTNGYYFNLIPQGGGVGMTFNIFSTSPSLAQRSFTTVTNAFPTTDTAFHHVVFTFNGNLTSPTYSLFVDGVSKSITTGTSGTMPSASAFGTPQLVMGGQGMAIVGSTLQNLANSFIGNIDDVRFYRGILNATDSMRVRNGGHVDTSKALWGYWMFDDGAGSKANNDGDTFPNSIADFAGAPTWSSNVPIITYELMPTCVDIESELAGYLPKIPVDPGNGTTTPSANETYYAVRKTTSGYSIRSCNSEPVGPGGTGSAPIIESTR